MIGYHNVSNASLDNLAVCQVDEIPKDFVEIRLWTRFWSKVASGADEACWPWKRAVSSGTSQGYGSFFLSGRRVGAHRVAWILTHGSVPEGLDVLHSCDNPPCCNPRHLSVGTHDRNLKDASARGLLTVPHPRNRRLTTEQVNDLLAYVLEANGRRGAITEAAARWGVTQPYVSMLIRGKRRQYDTPSAKPRLVRRSA